ncbi:MAG TPA: hypothetical protein VF099_05705, partial [Ktedonobacterales bacterium]
SLGQSLIDDASLPEWLRNMDPGSPPTVGAGSKPFTAPTQPASGPTGSASGVFSAAELIDTQSLPTWMKPDAASTTGAGSGTGPTAGPTGSDSGIFSAAELVDTQSLPAWLKTEEAATAAKNPQPAPGSGPAGSASGVFSAAELVDTQSLPAWLRADTSETAPGQEQQPTGTASPTGSASGVFSAAELVDTQSLPAWLKSEDQSAPPAGSAPATPANTDWKRSSSKIAAIPTGFSGSELVDPDSLPAWLKGAVADPSASQAGQSGPATQSSGQMSAAELVDTQSLPAWMRETGEGAAVSGTSGASQPSAGPASTASSQAGGFSAASLIDPEALPEWLHAAQGSEGRGPSQQESDQPTGQPWSQPMSSPLSEQGGLTGASLIDQEQLPNWLRNPTTLQRDGGQENGPQARVPRRPRLSNEPNRAPSQAAANVFSSVLGPTAGEESKGKQQNKRQAPQQEATDEWSSGQARPNDPRQSGEWGGSGMAPAAQRSQSQPRPQRGGLEGGPGAAGSADWQGAGAGMPPPDGRRMGARPSGPRPPAQPTWQDGQSGEWAAAQGPSDFQGGQARPNASYGPGGNAPPNFAGALPSAGAYGPGPQRRGGPQAPNAGMGQGDWENIPPGYSQGFAYDDDVGPPSGVFARIKRMLGIGR